MGSRNFFFDEKNKGLYCKNEPLGSKNVISGEREELLEQCLKRQKREGFGVQVEGLALSRSIDTLPLIISGKAEYVE